MPGPGGMGVPGPGGCLVQGVPAGGVPGLRGCLLPEGCLLWGGCVVLGGVGGECLVETPPGMAIHGTNKVINK